MIQLGDAITLTVRVSILSKHGGYEDKLLTVPAEVVYIHPEHRFYSVLITLPNGAKYRETLYFGRRATSNRERGAKA